MKKSCSFTHLHRFTRKNHRFFKTGKTSFSVLILLLISAFFLGAQDSAPDFTEAEKNFIREHPVVRVGIDPVFAPFVFLDNNGDYAGIAADYLSLISAKTSLRFEPATDISYVDAQKKVLARELDLLPTLGWTAEREKEFLLSQLYYEYKLAFVVREDSPIRDMNDFQGQPLAVQSNTSNAEFAFSVLKAGLSLYASEEEAVLAVAEGRETAMLGYLPTVLYSIRNLGLSHLNYITFDSERNDGFHMGVRNDWPELQSILNKVFSSLTPAEKAEIQNRWILMSNDKEIRDILYAVGVFVALLAAVLFVVFYFLMKNRRINKNLEALVADRTAELREQTRLALEASEAKSDFLANMSHEIRTPMNVVIGLTEVVSRRDLPEDTKSDIQDIKQAGRHLLSIINDILDISKIEAGKMELTDASYMLGSLLHDAENIIRFRIAETLLDFTVNVDPDLPGVLRGDMTRVRQILLNLLGNAVKFTRKGSVTFTVSCVARKDDEIMLSFEVADTGIGIRDEDIDKIFENFGRTDSARNRSIEGTGLGLTISRTLCRMMGGEITVRSSYGEGSVFTAVIPQKIADARPLAQYAEIVECNDEARGPGFIAPTARILSVDDSGTNLAVLRGLLSPFRAMIDECLTGEEAVEMVKRNRYDLIYMDHMMPGMDGIEAVKEIRSWEGGDGDAVPIIALTANAIVGMREMFFENGFNDFLPKPIETPSLNRIMEKWVPLEKRSEVEKDERDGNDGVRSDEPSEVFEIEGFDTVHGLFMTGGSVRQYREVLSLLCREIDERLLSLRETADKADLSAFTTNVHALKSSLASVGAFAMSEEAKALENAGKAGDTDFIKENAPAFFETLSVLSARVLRTLANDEEDDTADAQPGAETIALLREALAVEDGVAAERYLDVLRDAAHDGHTKKILSDISYSVLLADFEEAVRAADALMKEAKGDVCITAHYFA
jgi:signal transduction histidine kinase/CheY-like chemotaxis protein